MSEEEKKARPIWWQRAKKIIFFSQLIHSLVVAGIVVWGVGVIIDNRISEVLSTPRRTTALELKDSSQFYRIDSSLTRHGNYIAVIFRHVDTSKKIMP